MMTPNSHILHGSGIQRPFLHEDCFPVTFRNSEPHGGSASLIGPFPLTLTEQSSNYSCTCDSGPPNIATVAKEVPTEKLTHNSPH